MGIVFGCIDGLLDGCELGRRLGLLTGCELGRLEGWEEGCADDLCEGSAEGFTVGCLVGWQLG